MEIATRPIPFEVVYSSRRRTIQIAIRAPGQVVVTAPARCTDRELHALVAKKARWITKKLDAMRSAPTAPVVRELVSGETLPYLGRDCRLELQLDAKVRKPAIALVAGQISIHSKAADQAYLRAHLIAWYGNRAAEMISARVRHFADKMGVAPQAVTVKNQKKRWGSCTSTGKIYFNWRGILAPPPVIDYIVVHELCHLLEMNHSARFWSRLRAILPDYEIQKKWLKENGSKLDV
jgi:hypothetical protein